MPPTFSRLPPDGDEFPSSWSDEQQSHNNDSTGIPYRTKRSSKMGNTYNIIDDNECTPPPLPKCGPPPVDDICCSNSDKGPPPLPCAIPPVPPRRTMGRQTSMEDNKKKILEPSNAKGAVEPSRKSVKDKIAMFSSRSSSSEDSTDSIVPAPNHRGLLPLSTSSLTNKGYRSTAVSKSSDDFLEDGVILLPNGNTGAPPYDGKLGRSAIDLSSGTAGLRKSSLDSTTKLSQYTSSSTTNVTAAPSASETRGYKSPMFPDEDNDSGGLGKYKSPFQERSQSMIDVAEKPNCYQAKTIPANLSYITARPFSTFSLMEQRRRGLTKLKGLVIPDVCSTTTSDTNKSNDANAMMNGSKSVADLPTIVSKDVSQVGPRKLPPSGKSAVARTESLDRVNSSYRYHSLSSSTQNTTYENKTSIGRTNSNGYKEVSKEYSSNAIPKYSPAFKRRVVSTYEHSTNNNVKTWTPEPKSLESVTSPKSDSSFEFSSPSPPAAGERIISCHRIQTRLDEQPSKNNGCVNTKRRNSGAEILVTNNNKESIQQKYSPSSATTTSVPTKGRNGKLEDSDNDSAVSSSRSSISHELSPPNSPTPERSSGTPDLLDSSNGLGNESEDSKDEGWRILKAQSVEAINRKNVLTSAKFSNGVVNRDDSSSVSSSNEKNRDEDEEDAGDADAETEDTESSCSELEVTKIRNKRILSSSLSAQRRLSSSNAATRKNDTEEEEENEAMRPSHSAQSSADMGDMMIVPNLTESPLQAIYDMEVKMAYINEVCDALPGGVNSDSMSRYFARRDSETTVIERRIPENTTKSIATRKFSFDNTSTTTGGRISGPNSNTGERRMRNRSSSGNDSDFSSNVSSGSSNPAHNQIINEPTVPKYKLSDDKWSLLEKKYSRSTSAVNTVGTVPKETVTVPVGVPKIVTSASEVVEKRIEKMIGDGGKKVNKSTAAIPRGRNNFKSLTEKWQQMAEDPKVATTANTSHLVVPSVTKAVEECSPKSFTAKNPTTEHTTTTTKMIDTGKKLNNKEMEVDRAWEEKRRTERLTRPEPTGVKINSTKRSISVNDIRRAFEKATESAPEDRSTTDGTPAGDTFNTSNTNSGACSSPYSGGSNISNSNSSNGLNTGPASTTPNSNDGKLGSTVGGLNLPSAHFRVSSFDSTTSEESSATTPAGMYGSSNSLVSSAPRDPYGSITSLASSTSLISPQVCK